MEVHNAVTPTAEQVEGFLAPRRRWADLHGEPAQI